MRGSRASQIMHSPLAPPQTDATRRRHQVRTTGAKCAGEGVRSFSFIPGSSWAMGVKYAVAMRPQVQAFFFLHPNLPLLLFDFASQEPFS